MSGDAARWRARRSWQLLEPLHAVVYFAPEVRDRYRQAGVKRFWTGYFASRSYPLGTPPPEVVAAAFFNFHPSMVARALPDAWRSATVDEIAAARYAGVDAALRRILGAHLASAAVEEAAALVAHAAASCEIAGRPLFAAYAALPWPEEPHLRLWHGATLLREHRGDGHVIANVAHGVDGVEAHLMMSASSGIGREVLQPNRGWSDDDWDRARLRLTDRGLLDGRSLTGAGRRTRQRVEDLTDDLAAPPWNELGEATDRLWEIVRPLAEQIVAAGAIPVPNPMGVPWPPDGPLAG